MSRKNRYKIRILKACKEASYKHLIGKEFYLTVSDVKVHSRYYSVVTGSEDSYLFYKTDVWLIDTQRPELSQSIHFSDDIDDRVRANALFFQIKQMNLFKEIWYLKSSHPYSEGLWIEFGSETQVMKAFHGYVIEHYESQEIILARALVVGSIIGREEPLKAKPLEMDALKSQVSNEFLNSLNFGDENN